MEAALRAFTLPVMRQRKKYRALSARTRQNANILDDTFQHDRSLYRDILYSMRQTGVRGVATSTNAEARR